MHSTWLLHQTRRQSTFSKSTLSVAAPPDWKTEYIQEEYTQRGCSTGTRLEDRVHSGRVNSAWLLHRYQTGRQSTFSKSTLSVADPPDWKTEYIQEEYTQRGCSTRLEDRVHSARVHSAWLLHRYQTGRQYIRQEYTQRGCFTRLKGRVHSAIVHQRGWSTRLEDRVHSAIVHSAWLIHQTGRQSTFQQEYTHGGCSTRLEDSTSGKSTLSAAAPPVPDWKTVPSARVHSAWLFRQTEIQSTFSKSTLSVAAPSN